MRLIAGVIAAVMMVGGPAKAAWLKTTSRHFVIYSDTSEESARRMATRLERVDGALRLLSGAADPPEQAANPVTVYVLDTAQAVSRLAGGRDVAGLYVGRASGAVAFTPRLGTNEELEPQVVLFHEYAHHFLLGQSQIAFPPWFSEGYAEFVSTARFTDKGVALGGAANHRAYGLLDTSPLPIRTLLAPGGRLDGMQTDQLYGRGWLLTHYLIVGGKRPGQLSAYLKALNAGLKPIDAAEKAFGDLKVLDRELNGYMSQLRRRVAGYAFTDGQLPVGAIDVRPLTAGERALIDLRITSTYGVNAKTAGPLYQRAARAAAPFAGDAVAQGWLAEMALDAGRIDEAEAAADRALAVDPRSMQALMYKGMARLRRAGDGNLPADDKAWGEARAWIVRANRVDTLAAAPLEAFYDSFVMAGATPRKAAIDGLHRAQELAPQDDALRFASARQALIDGEVEFAKRTLRPLAYAPHAGADNPAARLLAMVEGGSTGRAALAALEAEQKAAAEKAKPAS